MEAGLQRSIMFNGSKGDFATPLAPTLMAKTLRYSAASEHLLRRLGSALVLQWDALPDDLQDLLIDQAAGVEDRDEAPHTPEHLERFVRTVKSAPLRPIVQGAVPN